jgi:catechol 2,3-dioxygenase
MRSHRFLDHVVSESLYLRDPENNGTEYYCDRPSEEWPRDSEWRLIMDTSPFNLQSILSQKVNNSESSLDASPIYS